MRQRETTRFIIRKYKGIRKLKTFIRKYKIQV